MPPSIASTTASTSKARPSKRQNTLSILLAESVVFLRTNDTTGRNRYGDSQTSIVRGLLVLDVVKPMKISAIELELIAKSATAWPEGVGAHRTDITEVHRVFEAKDVVWSAAGYSGWRTNSGKGKKVHDGFQIETVEEEENQLDPEEPQPPTYAESEISDDIIRTDTSHSGTLTPPSPSFISVTTPSTFSSARASTSTASTSLNSAFTMSPSTSAASASTGSSVLSSVNPLEESLPRTHASQISRPPPFDDVPEHKYDSADVNYANRRDPDLANSGTPTLAHASPSRSAHRVGTASNLPGDESAPADNSTTPLVPNRPVLFNTIPSSGQALPTANADPGTEFDLNGRTTQTKKRRFSVSNLVSSLFGSKKKRKKGKGKEKGKQPVTETLNQVSSGSDTTDMYQDAGRGGSKSVAHSRSRMSMISSGGVTVASEETVKPKDRSSRPSSIFRGRRKSKARESIPPLPPPPTTPPPVPVSSASSVRSVPLPSTSTSVPRPSFASAINLHQPPASVPYISHPYSSSHSTSIGTQSPATSRTTTAASSAYPSSSDLTPPSVASSSRKSGFIGFREGRERRRDREREREESIAESAVTEETAPQSEESTELPVWKEFRKGTYTYPITFRIPGHAPPTLECTYGSVTWRIKGIVRRHGTFSSNLTTTSPLLVISSPTPLLYSPSAPADPFYGALEENILVERHWDDQLHYSINVSEKTEYLTQFRRVARTDPVYTIPLLSLRDHNTSSKDQKWILPIPQGMTVEESPLHDVLRSPISDSGGDTSPTSADVEDKSDADVEDVVETRTEHVLPDPDLKLLPLIQPSSSRHQRSSLLVRQREETIQSLQSPYGPWSFHADLPLPTSCRVMRPSNRNRRSNMNVTHVLKCVVRVERGEDEDEDDEFLSVKPKKDSKKRKLFDIVIQTPIQILSCRCSPEYTSLPYYNEEVDREDIDSGLSMLCPCQRNSGSVRSLGRPGSFTGSTWSVKDKRTSIGSIGSGGRSAHEKRSSISSIASGGSGSSPTSPIPPVPPLPAHLQSNNTMGKRNSLAFSVISGASTTAFSTMTSSHSAIPADTLAERNKQLERLVSGTEWEDGGVVPAYSD
ncbi:hypothetical protein V5O48_012560 [Marasmius crinis-equi]|uniref:Arrestin-like N-terminal domain-containing protein n=1 Tax=Marasmius crinis-equi TaxID=585013 RepID=A0ABR3F2F6_9AGAR